MGEEYIYRCDLCKDTVLQAEGAGWQRATLAPLQPAVPGPPPVNTALMDWHAAQQQPSQAIVCPKPECLAGWANGENQRRADEKAAEEQAAKDAAEAQAKYAAEVAAQEAAMQAAAAVPAPDVPAPA